MPQVSKHFSQAEPPWTSLKNAHLMSVARKFPRGIDFLTLLNLRVITWVMWHFIANSGAVNKLLVGRLWRTGISITCEMLRSSIRVVLSLFYPTHLFRDIRVFLRQAILFSFTKPVLKRRQKHGLSSNFLFRVPSGVIRF